MFNFPELCAVLEESKAARSLPNREALLPALQDVYAHPEKVAAMKSAALALAEQNHSVIDAYAEEIILLLIDKKMKAPAFWNKTPPTVCAKILAPLGGLYAAIVRTRLKHKRCG